MGHGPGEVQRYVLDFVEVATDAGVWVATRSAVVSARGAGLSAREGAQQYVRNWRDFLDTSDLQRSQKESTMRAIRALVRAGRLETDGRAGPVSIAGMHSAYEAAVASARPSLERYITRYGSRLPPYVQEQYEQQLHDAFRARAAIVRRGAAQRRR